MKIKEIETSGVVEGVVTSLEERETKTSGSYVNVGFCDGDQRIVAKKWNTTLADFPFTKGNAVFLTLRADSYEGKISYVIKEAIASSSAPENFIFSAPVQPEAMFTFLYKTGEKCGRYAPVVTQILNDYHDKLLVWAGAKKIHHNIRGGLLYHMYRMTKCGAYIASVYNKCPSAFSDGRVIDTELLVAGTILHDIGKLGELNTDQLGDAEYTPRGSLMGHLYLGAELVGRYARKLKLDEESIMLLQHMILSHHGSYEWHTVALPAIPEAMILHHLDMIDSSLYQFEEETSNLEPGTMSGRIQTLGGPVYRPTWRKG